MDLMCLCYIFEFLPCFLCVPRFFQLAKIALTVLVTFALCWMPFLSDPKQSLQVLNRLFPIGRGLFEVIPLLCMHHHKASMGKLCEVHLNRSPFIDSIFEYLTLGENLFSTRHWSQKLSL